MKWKDLLKEIQKAMEKTMQSVSIQDIMNDAKKLIGLSNPDSFV